jgi:phospholipid/cholesterol/gamma-HCH transport system substrate-binding protein
MMENRAHALTTGFFTIALVIATVLFGIWFNRDSVERVPYLMATTLSVPGLNPQAAVRYRGMDVGKVDAINFDPTVSGQILVHLSVNPGTPVTTSTFATLGYQGVTGIAYVQLDDDSVGSTLLASNARNPARIELRSGLLGQLEKRGKVVLEQAELMTRNLNALLSAENRNTMIAAFADISASAKEFGAIERQLAPTLARLPALTDKAEQSLEAVTAFSNDARRLSKNWDALATRLQAQGGLVDSMARASGSVESVAGSIEVETLPHVIQLADEMRSSMRALKSTMDSINDRPQSILFGAPGAPPGPGEIGFDAPQKQGPP